MLNLLLVKLLWSCSIHHHPAHLPEASAQFVGVISVTHLNLISLWLLHPPTARLFRGLGIGHINLLSIDGEYTSWNVTLSYWYCNIYLMPVHGWDDLISVIHPNLGIYYLDITFDGVYSIGLVWGRGMNCYLLHLFNTCVLLGQDDIKYPSQPIISLIANLLY